MKKFGLILLVFLLVLCNSSNESTEVVDTTTTLINEEISIDEEMLQQLHRQTTLQIHLLLKITNTIKKKCHHLQA